MHLLSLFSSFFPPWSESDAEFPTAAACPAYPLTVPYITILTLQVYIRACMRIHSCVKARDT